MTFWQADNLARVTAGRWLSEPDPSAPLMGLGHDTRTLSPGEGYIAIKGERFDGHAFLNTAFEAGASFAVVSEEQAAHPPPGPLLLVSDTVLAMQALAAAWRDELANAGCKVIAVGGSNGKTTTRHLVHSVLASRFSGTQSPKSFNNHIGVPLTLLGARAEHDFVVVEIGTNHPGEIAELGRLVRPDAAIITSIGQEHMEFFGSLEAVADEELSLVPHTREGGIVVVPSTQHARIELGGEYLRKRVKPLLKGTERVRVGDGEKCDLRIVPHPKASRPGGQVFDVEDEAGIALMRIRLPLLGVHNLANATYAVAIGRWMGVSDQQIADALSTVQPLEGRLEVRRYGQNGDGLTVIFDAYNANPTSVAAAAQALFNYPASRHVIVLGDMLELGPDGPDLHDQAARAVAEAQQDARESADMAALTIGRLAMFAAQVLTKKWGNDRVHPFALWTDDLPQQVASTLRPGDVVLLKASRGMQLERIIPAIKARFGEDVGE